MKAIGYLRVSTEEQAKNGASLRTQEERIKDYCRARQWELKGFEVDDGRSGKDLKRPGIQRVIKGAEAKAFDVVVICQLDRLTRRLKDLTYLAEDVFEKNGIGFTSVQDSFDTTSASGKLILNVLGAVAQWQREDTSERIKRNFASKKKNGETIGHTLYGYDVVGKKLIKNEEEQGVIKKVKRWKSRLSLRAIARRLNEAGIKPKRASVWYPGTVKLILERG